MSRRTAIVTGSTSGIGLVIAKRLHADGLNVLITGRDERRGGQVREELGDRTSFVALDLTAEGAPAALAAAAVDTFGRLDVVVNNAAQDHTGDLLDVPIDDIRRVLPSCKPRPSAWTAAARSSTSAPDSRRSAFPP